MAKIKNTGGQPRGFNTEDGGHVVVGPGEEKEFNMTEADFKHLQSVMESHDDPKPFEVSGSHGGVKPEKKSVEEGGEMPAQSTEPPDSQPHQETMQPTITPMTEKERREREAGPRGAQKKPDDDDKPAHRGR
jgi:hypothetical protein